MRIMCYVDIYNTCHTKCPYLEGVMVASANCQRCPYYGGGSSMEVECTYENGTGEEKIKRYIIRGGWGQKVPREHKNGAWVRHDDHVAQLSKAEDQNKALTKALQKAKDHMECMNDDHDSYCMSGERTHKIIGLCGQGKQAIKYPADVAKEKLLESCKPEYWNYIEKHLAGDFACEIVSQLSKVTEERDRAVELLEDSEIIAKGYIDLIDRVLEENAISILPEVDQLKTMLSNFLSSLKESEE